MSPPRGLQRGRKGKYSQPNPLGRVLPPSDNRHGRENVQDRTTPAQFLNESDTNSSSNDTMKLKELDEKKKKAAQKVAQRRKPELDKSRPAGFNQNERRANETVASSDDEEVMPPPKAAGRKPNKPAENHSNPVDASHTGEANVRDDSPVTLFEELQGEQLSQGGASRLSVGSSQGELLQPQLSGDSSSAASRVSVPRPPVSAEFRSWIKTSVLANKSAIIPSGIQRPEATGLSKTFNVLEQPEPVVTALGNRKGSITTDLPPSEKAKMGKGERKKMVFDSTEESGSDESLKTSGQPKSGVPSNIRDSNAEESREEGSYNGRFDRSRKNSVPTPLEQNAENAISHEDRQNFHRSGRSRRRLIDDATITLSPHRSLANVSGEQSTSHHQHQTFDVKKPPDSRQTSHRSDSGKFHTYKDLKTWVETVAEDNIPTSDHPLAGVNKEINQKISVFLGDITSLEIDSIVNAANNDLWAGAGVCGKIHAAAGSGLRDECQALGGCETGGAVLTNGYKLPAKFVIHAVGPKGENPEKLRSAYHESLNRMKEKGLRSIAFPCISTGIFGYSSEKAGPEAIYSVRQWLDDPSNLEAVDRVIFCLFTQSDIGTYRDWLPKYFPCESSSQSATKPPVSTDRKKRKLSRNQSRKQTSSSSKTRERTHQLFSSDDEQTEMMSAEKSAEPGMAEILEATAVPDQPPHLLPSQPVLAAPPPIPFSAAKATLNRRNILVDPVRPLPFLMERFINSTPRSTAPLPFCPDLSQIGRPQNRFVNSPAPLSAPLPSSSEAKTTEASNSDDWMTIDARVVFNDGRAGTAAPVVAPMIINLPPTKSGPQQPTYNNSPTVDQNGAESRRSVYLTKRPIRDADRSASSHPPVKRISLDLEPTRADHAADVYIFDASNSGEAETEALATNKTWSRKGAAKKQDRSQPTEQSDDRSNFASSQPSADLRKTGPQSQRAAELNAICSAVPMPNAQSSSESDGSEKDKSRRKSVAFSAHDPIIHEPQQSLYSTDSYTHSLHTPAHRRIDMSHGSNTTGYMSGESLKHYAEQSGYDSTAASFDSDGVFVAPPPPQRIAPTMTPGCRRSQRTRCAPCRHWLGERPNYVEEPDGGRTFTGFEQQHLDPLAAKYGLSAMPDPDLLRKQKEKMKKAKKGLRKRIPKPPKELSIHVENAHTLMDRSELENYEQPMEVMNVNSGGTSSVVCCTVLNDETMGLMNESGNPAALNDNLGIAKIFPETGVNMGYLVLRPLSEMNGKTLRFSFMYFCVLHGSLLVTINGCEKKISTSPQSSTNFIVPSGNKFTIKNLRRDEARMQYVEIPQASSCNP